MRRSHSLRFLYEAFLPRREARFPDEKFWNPRTGQPIAAQKSSGPPKGTVGTTAKDWNVGNAPNAGADSVAVKDMDWDRAPNAEDISAAADEGVTVKVNELDDEQFANVDVSGPRDAVRKFLLDHGFDPDYEFEIAGIK